MSGLVPETAFAQGASGRENVYDTSPAGLGLSPSYLAPGANASATSGASGTVSTSIPSTPADGQGWIYIDSTNHLAWQFIYQAADSYWYFIGGAPLFSETATDETTTSATFANLSGGATGPALTVPFLGDYDVLIGCHEYNSAGQASMSYDIGGTGAVDADAVVPLSGTTAVIGSSRPRRKTAVAAATTLTCKYKVASGTAHFVDRFIAATPVRVH